MTGAADMICRPASSMCRRFFPTTMRRRSRSKPPVPPNRRARKKYFWVFKPPSQNICEIPKADNVRFTPQYRTLELSRTMSALCQKQTYAMQQNNLLFDHLVGEQQYRGWHFEAKLLRDFEI